MMRWGLLLVCEVAALCVSWVVPWAVLPALLMASAVAGFWSNTPNCTPDDRRQMARQVAGAHALVLGVVWFTTVGSPEDGGLSIPARVAVAIALGGGLGLAVGAAALIGADARAQGSKS